MYKILLITFFISFSLIAKECELPDEISDDYNNVLKQNINTSSEKSGKPYVFYNDTSSMLGFVVESLDNLESVDHNYKNVSNWIDSITSEMFEEDTTFIFFKGDDFDFDLNSVNYETFKNNVNDPVWYDCEGSQECNDLKTGFSDLTVYINEQNFSEKGDFVVIVTDLFIDNLEANNSSIKKMFENTFSNDQSIGIYGINSKYNGVIRNLPNGGTYSDASLRPFFVVTIGSKNKVLEFKELLDRDALKDTPDEDKNFTIFTSNLILSPVIPSNINKTKFQSNRILNQIQGWEKFPQLHKYTISRRKDESNIAIQFDLKDIQLPDTIPMQNFEIEVDVWQKKESDSVNCRKHWIKLTDTNYLAEISQANNILDIEFFGKNRLKKIKPKETYVANFKIFANNIGVNKDDFWMLDWDLEKTDVNDLTADSATFFKVLNLRKFLRKIESIQKDQFSRSLPIEFNIAFKLDK